MFMAKVERGKKDKNDAYLYEHRDEIVCSPHCEQEDQMDDRYDGSDDARGKNGDESSAEGSSTDLLDDSEGSNAQVPVRGDVS